MKPTQNVLLAEDDENDVFFMLRSFRAVGLSAAVNVVRDGQEAIEYLAGTGHYSEREKYPFPSLLILDLKMPRKTGMDVLAWLRQQPFLKTLPVLVFSSSANRLDVERAYLLWVNAFLTKPNDAVARSHVTGMIKEFWLGLNQVPAICTDGLDGARRLYEQSGLPPALI